MVRHSGHAPRGSSSIARNRRTISGYLMLPDSPGLARGFGSGAGGSLANRLPNLRVVAREWPAIPPGTVLGEWLERGLHGPK
jgi:hypothetical protein